MSGIEKQQGSYLKNSNLVINKAVDPPVLEVLCDISVRLRDLKIPFFLIGAVARDIIAATYGAKATRRTGDLDLAVMVKSEEEFVRAKSALIDSKKYSQDPKQEQRLYFQKTICVDLVPFGGLENSERKIRLPPSHTFVMNVRGFQEAYEASNTLGLGEGLTVRIVTVEDLVLLKFIAWNDRPSERERDAEDIAYIFSEYDKFAPDTFDVLYEEHTDILDANGHNVDLAAIQLLALRLRPKTKPETLALLQEITGTEPKQTKFVAAMLARKMDDGNRPDEARKRLIAFRRGLG